MAKITKPATSSRGSANKRHSTASLESPTTSEPSRDSAKSKKAHAHHARATKARASMACERCKHKKVKCEDYVEGQGCEKCRMNNEICYFHRKEVEIKTSFRQGYVENCERECEHLKELVVRMYKEASEGNPLKTVETVPKDGHPNVTSLMHAYGVGLGEDFLGSYEARDTRLASEGQPMLTHNGKGDILLQPEGAETHPLQSPLESIEESSSTRGGDHDRTSHPSRSPSVDHYTSTTSQPMSRQSSTGSLFSNNSIPKQPNNLDEDMMETDVPSQPQRTKQSQRSPFSPPQLQQPAPIPHDESLAFGNIDNWLSVKTNWDGQTPFPKAKNPRPQSFNGVFADGFVPNKTPMNRAYFPNNNTIAPQNPQFSAQRQQQQQPLPFGYQSPEMFQGDMSQGFSDQLSPEDGLPMPGDGFFADNFMQGADNGVGFDYLDASVF